MSYYGHGWKASTYPDYELHRGDADCGKIWHSRAVVVVGSGI